MITRAAIKDLTVTLLQRAETSLPADVKVAIQRAYEHEVPGIAKVELVAMLENVRLAAELQRPICQDTGLPLFFLRLGRCDALTLSELETGIRFGSRPPGGSLQKG
jgi:fumarate hydratase subunit alpha